MNINKPYEEYKISKIPYINQIPKGWIEYPFYAIAYVKSVTKNVDEELLSVFLNKGVIKYNQSTGTQVHKPSQDLSNYQLVESGDLVLNNQQAWRGSVGVSKYRGIVSPAYYVFSLSNLINPKFGNYLFRDAVMVNQFVLSSKGVGSIQRNLYYPFLKRVRVLLPPLDEQDQIVKYLDFQLAKINKFIKSKKKLISILKEKKQAVVNEAVTKGLNPNVKMKPSGVDWLGEIPEHWEIKPLRQLLKPVSVKNRADLPLLSVVREKGVMLRSEMSKEENHNFIPDDLSGYKVVDIGQFAMNKMKAWQGSYGVSSYNGIVSPAYYIFNLFFDNKEYFHYAIRSKVYVNFFYQASDGIRIGQWDLSLNKMKDIPFFIPPEEEQSEIVQYIPHEFKRIEDSISKLQQEIDLITEYRTRLISDVVTGKVDVRDIEITEELEEIDIDEIEEDFNDNEEVVDSEECEV
ncbi:restriction endonuclease subunit S [Lysinibacillus sp. BSL11]